MEMTQMDDLSFRQVVERFQAAIIEADVMFSKLIDIKREWQWKVEELEQELRIERDKTSGDDVAERDCYKQAAKLLAVLIHNTDGLMPVRLCRRRDGLVTYQTWAGFTHEHIGHPQAGTDWLRTSDEIFEAVIKMTSEDE